MARKDRRQGTTEARIALRRRVVGLRKQGKSLAKTSAITGYAATYCSTLYRKYVDWPEELAGFARGGRLTAVQERGLVTAISNRRKVRFMMCGERLSAVEIEVIKSSRHSPQPVTVYSHVASVYLRRFAVARTTEMQANLPET